MRAAAGGGFSTATDIADYLVRQGIPFRQAHEVVGATVRWCETNGKELEDLTLEEWQTLDNRFDERVLDAARVENSVAARMSYGGTAPNVCVSNWRRRAKCWTGTQFDDRFTA
jgi:argininosuccinate lyase